MRDRRGTQADVVRLAKVVRVAAVDGSVGGGTEHVECLLLEEICVGIRGTECLSGQEGGRAVDAVGDTGDVDRELRHDF